MLTDIRVPLPEEHRSASARLRFAHETSERVFSNLRARLGDDFRVEAQPRS
ncbi:MAG: hypothetical protein HKP30_11975, partial [Myxococcales bacterium]|nr:hypothetical protein [Myxococcales bacterium]